LDYRGYGRNLPRMELIQMENSEQNTMPKSRRAIIERQLVLLRDELNLQKGIDDDMPRHNVRIIRAQVVQLELILHLADRFADVVFLRGQECD
jgi:hypothetical protein